MKNLNNKNKLNVECCDLIRIENLENVLNNITELIANCDEKASAVVAWCGVLISVLLVTDFVDKFICVASLMVGSGNLWAAMYLLIMSVVMGSFVVSFCFIVLALVTKNNKENRTISHSSSVLDPLCISRNKNLEEYLNLISNTTSENYKKDLIRQIYKMSVLYSKKMDWYKAGVEGVVGSFFIWLLMAFVAVLWVGKV